jgi:glycosyltransferase involved in cell wall biosynthesis
MPADLPKITIVTTCFNDVDYVEETLASIHGQNYPNLEHIVVDGGSRDGSVEIIRRYADKLAWWCSEPDGGHGDALAKGFAHATGDILGWVCSDDLLLPGSLARVARHFAAHPECRWLTGGGLMIDAEGKVIEKVFSIRMSQRSMVFWQFWGAVQPAIFFSGRAFREAGGVDGSFNLSPDLDICLRVARGGASDRIDDFLAALRLYPDTQTARHLDKMRAVDLDLRRREGHDAVPAVLRRLLYLAYNTRFINGQRLRKLVMRLGFGPGRDYEVGRPWSAGLGGN